MNSVNVMGTMIREVERKGENGGIGVSAIAIKDWREKEEIILNIVMYGKTIDFVEKYIRVGERIGVNGRLRSSTWTTADGSTRQKIEIVANEVYFADGKEATVDKGLNVYEIQDEEELPF